MKFSLDDNHIIVNYHYIDDPHPDRGGFHPCPPDEFEKQISFLSREYAVVSVREVFQAAKRGAKEKMCALTFDDGLKDNFTNALPILKKYSARGIFFPITKTLEGFLPATHGMHTLLSRASAEELADRLNSFLLETFPRIAEIFSVSKTRRLTTERKMYDNTATANLKETMNRLPRNVRDAYLDAAFRDFSLVKRDIARTLFMDEEEIKALVKAGHEVGGHGHSHDALDMIEQSEVRDEIAHSKKMLEKMLDASVDVFSYPQSAPSRKLHDILGGNGFSHALTTERRSVARDDSPFLIPRFDSNDIRDFLRFRII